MENKVSRQGMAALSLGALGVVYGDIGTSPLYTMKEVFAPHTGVPLDAAHIVGATSVIFWALMVVVTLKYVILILRADNRGEGGVMALTALAANTAGSNKRRRAILLSIGVFGAALFYGDSIITPAISVLGAIEGLNIVAPGLQNYVLPLSAGVLIVLFMFQRHGTAAVGKWFGPVIALWFITLAVTGVMQIIEQPAVLAALNPLQAWHFLMERGWHLFAAVGAIVLALTGAEALYADMGHFGRNPIRLAWTGLVLPSLALNYLGQGALLMSDAGALENPFYRLFSADFLIPAVILATAASVIASQAVISGAYSITRQAIQLGFLPRMQVHFTSAKEAGQIYMPAVNVALLVAVLLATVGFGSSSALAAAYGVAVTMTMFITTLLTFYVVRYSWRFSLPVALAATGIFLILDAVLVVSCLLKFTQGGWFPLLLGLVLFVFMATWERGRELLLKYMGMDDPALRPFISSIAKSELPRANRTAVYLVANPDTVPKALLHNLKHNQVLHAQSIICTVSYQDIPWVPDEERIDIESLEAGFWQARIHYGFKDTPDVPAALALARVPGLSINLFETSYFLSRETIVAVDEDIDGMAFWRERLFAFMSRNASGAAEFFKLPNNAVIELGTRVQI